jgi:CheY-like chemotaxis protein
MANPKVLIVEDDKIIVSIEQWRLPKLGYDICGSAGTGAEAMNSIAKIRSDIVLMDINLEGEIDGIETVGRIKKDFTIPVIFVLAYTDEATI